MRKGRSRHAQRGAAAVFAAIATVAGLAAVALAIDVGRLYTAQRDLQRAANLAALDAARVSGGCMGVPEDPRATAFNEALASIERNGGAREGVRVQRVELGREQAVNGQRSFATVGQDTLHTAARVVLTRPAPPRLLPFSRELRELAASASARSSPRATVHVGSRLAQLDEGLLNTLLGAALGKPPGISAVGYTALLEAQVPLDAVLDRIDDGNSGNVLLREVPVTGLLRGLADVVADTGNTAAAETARLIAQAADTAATVVPADLVTVGHDAARIAGGVLISAGELTVLAMQSTAQAAAIEMLYTLPAPLGDSTTLIRIVEPGQAGSLAPGQPGRDGGEPQSVGTAQALLQSTVSVPVSLLGTQLRLPVWLQLAQATAEVADIACARHGRPEDVVTVDARASISRLGIGEFSDINVPQPVAGPATLVDANLAAGLLGIPVPVRLRITAAASVDVPSERDRFYFDETHVPQTLGRPRSTALLESLAQLPGTLELDIRLDPLGPGGGLLGGVTSTVVDAAIAGALPQIRAALESEIAAAVARIGDGLLQDVLAIAGLTLGGADVTLLAVENDQPDVFAR